MTDLASLGVGAKGSANSSDQSCDPWLMKGRPWRHFRGCESGVVKAKNSQVDASANAAKREVERLLDELATAHLQSDGAALDRIRSDDFVITTADGRLMNKAQARVALDDFARSRYEHDDVRVRVYGETAVATGRISMQGSFRGHARNDQSRFTRIFVKREGRWQLVANQLTRIPQPKQTSE